MSVKQKAYIFNLQELNKTFQNDLLFEPINYMECLYSLARTEAKHPSKAMFSALEHLRYDEEWFDLSAPDISRESDWFLVFLTSKFSIAPDLSSSQPYSYAILGRVLELLGWEQDKIDWLIKGRDLKSLVSKLCHSSFFSEFTFSHYAAGWLDEEDISMLYTELLSLKEIFFEPSKQLLDASNDFSETFFLKPGEVIRKSYIEAEAMLLFALQSNSSLFIIFD